jgi:uncharacterized protein YeaO (DUF488 family)
MIRLKRVYEVPSASDGARFLVERLWPRGIKKSSLPIEAWLKDVAPSTELCKWFGHDRTRWSEFRTRYFTELEDKPDAWLPLLKAARDGAVTLIYSSRDSENNNAVALLDFLAMKLSAGVGSKNSRKLDLQSS